MKISIKINQRCLFCKKKLKKGDAICIRKDNTVLHKDCIPQMRQVVENHVRTIR